jgi:hypothetical protein
MLLVTCEREQNVEPIGLQRKEGLGLRHQSVYILTDT